MSNLDTPACKVCHLTTPPPKKCARCHVTPYCSPTCQKADWDAHKPDCCRFSGLPWYDLYRQCKDGTKHEGQLELITWSTPANEYEEILPEATGWGNVIVAEAEDLKREFETEMHGDEAKLYTQWPQAFRWTCCGATAQNRVGCDHHGEGEKPCRCDFCKVCFSNPGGTVVWVGLSTGWAFMF
ncbi:MAG: hypothetical protein Q9208_006458 [Pyrenodesmia sp. 3 TL-2023]